MRVYDDPSAIEWHGEHCTIHDTAAILRAIAEDVKAGVLPPERMSKFLSATALFHESMVQQMREAGLLPND